MWLVVGLGNPGKKYQHNRHNIGFFVVDELHRRLSRGGSFRDKFGGDVGTCFLGSDPSVKIVLLKPMEYMNHSGYAVQRAQRFFDIEPARTVIVHDEIDLAFPRLKLKSGGGHGGHNGLRSIVAQTSSRDFARVRCGVGKPVKTDGDTPGDGRVANHVLSDFPSSQQRDLDELVGKAADAVEAICERGIKVAMNEFNTKPAKPEAEADDKATRKGDEPAPKTDSGVS